MNEREVIYCAGCGVEICCDPYPHQGKIYCCLDCAQGLKCECTSRLEEDEYREQGQPSNIQPS